MAPETNGRPLSVAVTYGLLLAASMLWLVFGVLLALNVDPAFPDDALPRNAMAVVSLGAGSLLLLLLVLLVRRRRFAYTATLAALIAASAAVLLDDIGFVDLVVLAISLVPMLLLLKDRAWYVRS